MTLSTGPRPPIDVSQIVGKSFHIYVLRWRPHLVAAAIAQLPVVAPTLLLVNLLLDATVNVLATRSIDALLPAAGLSLALLAVSFVSAFLFVLMGAAACQLVAFWLDHQEVSLLAAYSFALQKFWRLALALLGAFAIILGSLIAVGAFFALFYIGFIVIFPRLFGEGTMAQELFDWALLIISCVAASAGFVILLDALVRWAVFIQVVMLEGSGPMAALKRSADLVRGNWWRTAGAMALLMVAPTVLMMVMATVLNVAFLPATRLAGAPDKLANSVAIGLAQISLSPVPAIGVTVLFYRLRDGKSIWARIERRIRGASPSPTAVGEDR